MKGYGRRKIILNIFWIILGAVLLVLSMTKTLNELYAGMGGGLIGVGIIQLIRGIRYNTDKDYRENYDTEAEDERNRFIRMKAWSWAGYIFVLAAGVVCLVCMIMGQTLYSQLAGYAVCLLVCLYWVSYMVLSRKY